MLQKSSGYDGALSGSLPSVILYEYPFNERIRTYLRLEHLFRRLAELVPRDHPIDHHYALATIFEVMDVAARADLKSDVMRDLEKQKSTLNSFRGNPAIAESVLDDVIARLDDCFAALNALPGKAGQALTENDWLMSIRSRVGIPGGTCEFDLPAYFAWQHLPAGVRRGGSAAIAPSGKSNDSNRMRTMGFSIGGLPSRDHRHTVAAPHATPSTRSHT